MSSEPPSARWWVKKNKKTKQLHFEWTIPLTFKPRFRSKVFVDQMDLSHLWKLMIDKSRLLGFKSHAPSGAYLSCRLSSVTDCCSERGVDFLRRVGSTEGFTTLHRVQLTHSHTHRLCITAVTPSTSCHIQAAGFWAKEQIHIWLYEETAETYLADDFTLEWSPRLTLWDEIIFLTLQKLQTFTVMINFSASAVDSFTWLWSKLFRLMDDKWINVETWWRYGFNDCCSTGFP